MRTEESAVSHGGNATPAAFPAASILYERELQAVLSTIHHRAEAIKDDFRTEGDEETPQAWYDADDIIEAVEQLESLLFSATGLREGAL